MSFFWPLMKNAITKEDKKSMIRFIEETERFTNGPKVREFEEEWSKWLGVKHSLYVSSGSTANFLLMAAVKERMGLKNGSKVLVPAMTWVTNVGPVLQLGLQPIFCDVDKQNFCFDENHMKELSEKHPDIEIVFVSHLFGLSGNMKKYKEIFPNAVFLEDVCESHGSMDDNEKTGTLSLGSTFSFYFGHHMTTIEGGFVCTDDTELYELMRAKRSHGLAREMSKDRFEKAKQQFPDVHPQFLFITDGYNFRNMEINAVLGLSQLKRLDDNNEKRKENYERFLKLISKYKTLKNDFKKEGSCAYCMTFVCETEDERKNLEQHLVENGVETRPLCGGNLLRQPFLKEYKMDITRESNVEFLHKNGFFIGNNHMIENEDFLQLGKLLEEFYNE